jgi:hypothetical protein
MGHTSADAVARAVVRAIGADRPEVLVNRPPLRPVFVLAAAFPRLGGWIVRMATRRFLRRAARSAPAAPTISLTAQRSSTGTARLQSDERACA